MTDEKCDEMHPTCSRCVKTNKKCVGYRDQSDLMFRDETTRTQTRFRQWETRNRGSDSTSASTTSLSLLLARASKWMYDNCVTPVDGLFPPIQDVVVCYFYHNTLGTISDKDPVHSLHSQLPNLYSRSDLGSALRLATEAISYATSTKLMQEAALLSRKRYIQAIKAIGKAIQDPQEMVNDQTLYAILLLSGYETISRDPDTTQSWGAHVDGAAALVKFRSTIEAHSPLSRSMFGFVRKSVVIGHMQICRPIDEIFCASDVTASSDKSPEDQLMAMAAKIPNLQYRSNCLFTQTQDARTGDVEDLFYRARALDREIADWARTLPTTWSYSAAVNIDNMTNSKFTPCQIHRYPDFYIARVWNFYRVSRLILQSVLLRATSWMSISTDLNEFSDERKPEGSSIELVNDICASVPFLLGHDLSKMKVVAKGGRIKQERTSGSRVKKSGSTHTGRFSLIWPLYVACSASSVPEAQRDWMHMQLRLLAEHGETEAHFACFKKSQILLGGADDVRFDCV
ncbi:unnamed protein product [Fusarium venenatum]|uniref:Zn(2)-C6 fungal-type domain-containing protein n=1 Tax=Fusarium venenatum TaxID=56646 RepID=A0A2L2TXD6_9HYPO|nr:uncharacterized protein FVRRES_10864 [Fusarium venenatum]CEI70787.1 unnamed protein product [Fusarium venenatum]